MSLTAEQIARLNAIGIPFIEDATDPRDSPTIIERLALPPQLHVPYGSSEAVNELAVVHCEALVARAIYRTEQWILRGFDLYGEPPTPEEIMAAERDGLLSGNPELVLWQTIDHEAREMYQPMNRAAACLSIAEVFKNQGQLVSGVVHYCQTLGIPVSQRPNVQQLRSQYETLEETAVAAFDLIRAHPFGQNKKLTIGHTLSLAARYKEHGIPEHGQVLQEPEEMPEEVIHGHV